MMYERTSAILVEELVALKKEIIENHLRAKQKASGRTIESLRVETDENSATLFGRGFFDVLETGRKGGKVPYDFQTIIRKWMQDKGIKARPIEYKTDRPHKYTPQERGERTLAFFIARNIRKNGTTLFRSGGRQDIYSDAIPKAIKRIKERLAGVVHTEISSIKINNIEV